MGKRGRCPSLISGKRPRKEIAKRKRQCKGCKSYIKKNEYCVSIPIPGQMGSRTYCLSCFKEIIDKTMSDLEDYKEIYEDGC